VPDADQGRVTQRVERLVDVGPGEVDPADDAGHEILGVGRARGTPDVSSASLITCTRTTLSTGVSATVDSSSSRPKFRRIGESGRHPAVVVRCRSQTCTCASTTASVIRWAPLLGLLDGNPCVPSLWICE
jgi:hypothetical protein